jgi:hypothetical protein
MSLTKKSYNRFSSLLVTACLTLVVSCGDDAGAPGDGCTTDAECKGDRICVDRECVDPGPFGDRDGGGDPGSAGRGASAAGGRGSTTAGRDAGNPGGGGSMVIDDPELERACGLNCEARAAASCAMNIGSVDQCMAQCLVIDEANRGYCLAEQRDQFACLASGGYTCISGYPQPKSTCVAESQALATCTQMAPCRTFCERAAGECAAEGDACLTECMERQTGFEDAICGIYYMQLLACWGPDLTCDGDRPAIGSCGAQVAEIADCVGRRNHDCDGFCWAADQLGCGGADCTTTCMTTADEVRCGSYYRSVLDCAIGNRALQFTCEDGVPTPDPVACSSAIDQYTTCMQGS